VKVAIAKLESNGNIRTELGDVTALAADIERRGLIQPIVVHRKDDGSLTVVDGHRRLAALVLNGETEAPITEYDLIADNADRISSQYAANVQRRDLTPYEQIKATLDLKDEGHTQKAIAADLGMSVKEVAKAQKIAKAIDVDRAGQANQMTIEGLTDLAEQADFDPDVVSRAIENVVGGTNNVWYAVKEAIQSVGVERWYNENGELVEWLAAKDIEIESRPDGYEWRAITATPLLDYPPRGADWLKVELDHHRNEICHLAFLHQSYEGSVHLIEACTDIGRHTTNGESELTDAGLDEQLAKNRDDRYKEQQQAARKEKAQRKKDAVAWLNDEAPAISSPDIKPYVDEAWRKLITNDLAQQFVKVMELEKVYSEHGNHYSAQLTLCAHIEQTYASPLSRANYAALFLHAYEFISEYHHRKELGL
jgi:ParB/RepB/Spo0J family partition protein